MIVRESPRQTQLGRRFGTLQAAVAQHGAPSIQERRAHLRALERIVKQYSNDIAQALDADFGQRSVHETRLVEIFPIIEAARHARRHLERWARAERKAVVPYFFPARARIMWQPLGVVGIVVPWNYPVLLALQPLIGALAAGNRVMLKMSEFTPQTTRIVTQMLHVVFADDHVRVESGGIETGKAFTALPFDHLLFTGATNTGRSVMRSAASNLTPLTLELGGKSPVIVAPDAALRRAAARIMSGKCRNAGQTCIAPDYVLLPNGKSEAFIAAARDVVATRYPSLATGHDYTSIVSDAHFERLMSLLADARAKGATVVPLDPRLPAGDRVSRIVPPAVIVDVRDDMRIMQEEIFGPLLPLRTYATLAEAIDYVNARPRPLALYYFGENAADADTVLSRTASGGACINDVMLQFAQNDLPFGGVGASGMGAYHGRAGFETFSHRKAIFEQTKLTGYSLLEPPYGKRFELLLRFLRR